MSAVYLEVGNNKSLLGKDQRWQYEIMRKQLWGNYEISIPSTMEPPDKAVKVSAISVEDFLRNHQKTLNLTKIWLCVFGVY